MDTNVNERDIIAVKFAQALARPGVGAEPNDFHRKFADAIIDKDAYALKHLANGMNNIGKRVFSEVVGVKLPKTQAATWEAIRDWAGVTDAQDAQRNADIQAQRDARRAQEAEEDAIEKVTNALGTLPDGTVISVKEFIDVTIKNGHTRIEKRQKGAVPYYVLANPDTQCNYILNKAQKAYAEIALRSEIALRMNDENNINKVVNSEVEDASNADFAHLFGKIN